MLSPACSKWLLTLGYFISLIFYRHEMKSGNQDEKWEKNAVYVMTIVQINMLAEFNPMEKLK